MFVVNGLLAQFDIKSIQHTGNAAPSSQIDNFLDTRLSLATQQHSTDEPSAFIVWMLLFFLTLGMR